MGLSIHSRIKEYLISEGINYQLSILERSEQNGVESA